MILIPPHIPHCWYFDGNITDYRGRIANITVKFDNEFLNRCSQCFTEFSSTISQIKSIEAAIKFDKNTSEALSNILMQMREQTDAEKALSFMRIILLISNNTTQTIVGRQRHIDKDKERLRQIDIYVTCNFKQNITLENIARHIGMNRASFCVFFKKATGQTFVSYLNRVTDKTSTGVYIQMHLLVMN